MKIYIKSNTDEKPILDSVRTSWKELGDGSGIVFTIFSPSNEILFEQIFDYNDVDPDNIYESAIDMAILALSLQYELTGKAINIIKETHVESL